MNFFNFNLNLFESPSGEKTAAWIVDRIARSSFRTFRDRKFRRLTNFDNVEQTEQDRFFNELVVSGLSLALLMMEMAYQIVNGKYQELYKDIKENILKQYTKYLESIEANNQIVRDWQKLINLRCNEYYDMRLKNRKYLPEAAEGNPWVIVVAAGCVDHLKRGQNSPDESLFKFILNRIGDLTIIIEKRLIRDAKRL